MTLEWSPDGSTIVFSFGDDGSSSVYAVEADGSRLEIVAEGGNGHTPRSNVSPRISPDGSTVAYAGMLKTGLFGWDGYSWEIYTSRLDGSHKRRLTDNVRVTDTNPTWSPDGNRLAFASKVQQADAPNAGVHYTMAADGSDVRPLTSYGFRHRLYSPIWSPDGRQLAVHGWPDGEPMPTLNTVNVVGTNLRKVANTPNPFASWSPDSRRLAFAIEAYLNVLGPVEGMPQGVYTVASDGSDLRRVIRRADLPDTRTLSWTRLAWSPDGTEILIARHGALFTVHPDGSGLRQLYADPEFATETIAAWSPDGSRIAFWGGHSAAARLVTMARDGTDVRVLVNCLSRYFIGCRLEGWVPTVVPRSERR